MKKVILEFSFFINFFKLMVIFVKNYRGITLTSIGAKIYNALLLNWIKGGVIVV